MRRRIFEWYPARVAILDCEFEARLRKVKLGSGMLKSEEIPNIRYGQPVIISCKAYEHWEGRIGLPREVEWWERKIPIRRRYGIDGDGSGRGT